MPSLSQGVGSFDCGMRIFQIIVRELSPLLASEF